MSLAKHLLMLALCAACLSTAVAHAQESDVVKPLPQTNQGATQMPKKANARPAAEAGAKTEPFDKATVEKMAGQCVKLETEAGTIEVEMLAGIAPETVRNFLNLAATGAYDTTTFSRVVKGFVIQGGDLATREKLTPELSRRAARTIPDEPNAVRHVRGVVSMARTGEPNSATTHFFILAGEGPHLDGTFAAFGRVRDGMEVVDKINGAEVENEKPSKPVRLKRAAVASCAPMPSLP
ncbi:MAG: peptidylprolyl isomerase [Acidobacteria bacterium]|nr:peptidylprolyl isomerase [Acidobacteriota bacterium]